MDLARSMRRTPALGSVGLALLDRLSSDEGGSQPVAQRRRMHVLDVVDALADAAAEPTFLAFEDLHWADDLSLEVIGVAGPAAHRRPAVRRRDAPGRGGRVQPRLRRVARPAADPAPRRRGPAAPPDARRDGRHGAGPAGRPLGRRRTPSRRSTSARTASRSTSRSSWACSRTARWRPPTTSGPPTSRRRSRPRCSSGCGHRSDAAQAIAAAGAVVGRRFLPSVVGRIVELPDERLAEPLDELVAHAFLEPSARTGEVDFRNQLLRDAVYAAIPAAERRRLHGLVADLGGERDIGSEIHASAHLELAGRTDEAHRAALAGARAASRISAHREAMELYRRAVRNLPPDAPPADRGRILEDLAREESARDETGAAAATLVKRTRRVRRGGRPAGGRGGRGPPRRRPAPARRRPGDGPAPARARDRGARGPGWRRGRSWCAPGWRPRWRGLHAGPRPGRPPSCTRPVRSSSPGRPGDAATELDALARSSRSARSPGASTRRSGSRRGSSPDAASCTSTTRPGARSGWRAPACPRCSCTTWPNAGCATGSRSPSRTSCGTTAAT